MLGAWFVPWDEVMLISRPLNINLITQGDAALNPAAD